MGKPPGSRNRRTLDRIRLTEEGNMSDNVTNAGDNASSLGQAGNRAPGLDISPDSLGLQQDWNGLQGSTEMPETTDLHGLSNFLDSFGSLDTPQPSLRSADDFCETTGLGREDGETTVAGSVEPSFTDIGVAEPQLLWPGTPDDNWSCVSSCANERTTADATAAGTILLVQL
ncbi:MAG: hypothetical protein Q9178_004448 [Gyalolechia marmorata]